MMKKKLYIYCNLVLGLLLSIPVVQAQNNISVEPKIDNSKGFEETTTQYPELDDYFNSKEYQDLPIDSAYSPQITHVRISDKRVAHLIDDYGTIINPLYNFSTQNTYKDGGDVIGTSTIIPDTISFVEISGKVYYQLKLSSSRLTEFLPAEIIDYKNYPGFLLLEIMLDINKMADSYRKNGADSVRVFGENSFRVYKRFEDINEQDNVDIPRDEYPGFFGVALAENGVFLPLKMKYPDANVELREFRTTNSRHFVKDDFENEALFSIRPTAYPILPSTHSISVHDLSSEQRLKLKWVDLPACYPTPSSEPGKSVYLVHFDETMYGHSVYCTNDASNPYVWISAPSDGNIYSTVGSLEDDDFWSGDEHNYNRIHDKFDLTSIQNNSDVTAAQYETFLPNHEPYVTGDCDGLYNWTEVKPEVKNMVNNMLPAHNTQNGGNAGINDTYTDYWYDDVENGTIYYVANTWDWDKDMGYTGYDVNYNAAGLTHIESCINGVNWHIVGMSDYDEHNQSPTYWQAVANYNYYSNFRVYYIPCYMAPTSLVANVNGAASASVCSGSVINLTMDSFDGGGCVCGSWEYAWTNGANWWNGASFSSGSAVYSTAYSSINTTISSSTTYTLNARCSAGGGVTSDNVGVIIYTYSTAPTSISGTSTICPGGNVELTVVGGSLGTGASWEWYTAGCGVTPAGSGSSITVSPGVATTYYVRAEGTCNTTGCTNKSISISTNSTAAISASAFPASVSPGGASTISVIGGSLGTGGIWHWYIGGCGGTEIGTGVSIVVNPTVNTTYFVQAEGTCNTTACESVTVFVTGTVTICNGDVLRLEQVAGVLGTGAVWQWYYGSCGGTFVGNGNPIDVTPISNITYFARASGDCNTTGCAIMNVIVNQPSTAPTSITGTNNICVGGSTTLTVNGGSLGTNATWNWYSSSCGGTYEGSGSSILVNPASTTTYYVRAEGTCNTTACASGFIVTVTADPSVSISASANDFCEGGAVSFTQITGGGVGSSTNQWQYSTDGSSWTNWVTSVDPTYIPLTSSLLFRLVRSAAGAGCTTAISNTEIVSVVTDPIIDSHPSSPASVCLAGASGNMIVAVSGGTGSYSYQWQYYNGSTWSNVVNGTPTGATYSGATSATFSVSGTSTAGDYDYRCVISQSGGGCGTLTTNHATVTFDPNPTITVDGSITEICSGGSVTMMATPSGSTGTNTYQWQSASNTGGPWSNIAGATSLAYITPGLVSTTYYRIVLNVGAGCGSATSGYNTVNINADPSVSANPVGGSRCVGIPLTMSITAAGGIGAYSYQWQWDNGGAWENISGANSSFYDASPSVNTDYHCLVTTGGDHCDIATSASATLNITAPPTTSLVGTDYIWSGYTSADWETTSNWLVYDGTNYWVTTSLPDNTKNVFLRANAPCVLNAATTTASSTVSCHDLNIETGFTLGNISQINVFGDWNNSGTYNAGTGTASFNGTALQTIDAGGDDFNDVIFNNSYSNNADVEIITPMVIDGSGVFIDGVVYYAGSGSLTFSASATTNGGSNTSFVDGLVEKINCPTGSGFMFPLGDVNTRDIGSGNQTYAIWGPINALPENTITITAEYLYSNVGLNQWWYHDWTHEAPLTHTTDREYWLVNSSESIFATLYWRNNDPCSIHDFCEPGPIFNAGDLTIAYWDNIWKDAGGTATTSYQNGNITSTIYIPFGAKGERQITFAAKNKDMPLPVELTEFNAECLGNSASISWQTVSETNNAYFVLEKSNGKDKFHEVSRIRGAGNSNEILNYEFIDESLFKGDNYYRLKQIDFDGKITEYNTITINCDNQFMTEPVMHAFPNPFSDELNVVIDNIQESDFVLEIFDDLGRIVYTEKCSSNGSQYKTILKLDNLRPAVYNLRSRSDDNVLNVRVVKK